MSISNIHDILAIDVHAHYGDFRNSHDPLVNCFRSADMETVAARAAESNTEFTIVSPLQALVPRGNNDPEGGNNDAAVNVPNIPSLRFWVVIDPLRHSTYAQAAAMLKQPACVGIKIHPEEHIYPIAEHGRALFEFAQEHDAVILTHSGEQNSLPGDFVPFADDFPTVKLILAHLGCGYDGDPSHQVRAIQQARGDNLFVDTSSAQSIMPHLIEWAVEKIGPQKILYGTDTPLYHVPMQRVRIDKADISDDAKRLILRENALSLLPLYQKVSTQ